MKKINKRSYEGVCRKVASLCVVSMLLNVSMMGTVFSAPEAQGAPIESEELCEAAVDVVLIMDRSGSMSWEIPTRISQAKNAANDFLGNLGADDQSAVVSYASEVTLDKELSGDHPATQTAVNNLIARGGTNIGDAIYLSNQELGSARTNPQAVKAVILLTDGRATCPYYDSEKYGMCGFVEDDEDIAYTLSAAEAAADLGYKIFTIGLGRQYKINEEMLQEVAETTGAEYYHAPSSGDLESIYESIRWELCEYGSISGCKYNDLDKDGDDSDFVVEDTISDWEIILTGETNGPITQLTDENGCYQFSGLLSGDYVVSEGGKDGITDFIQTYPQDPSLSYNITLVNEEDLSGYDFGNYFPICGNGILDSGEQCDDGNTDDSDSCSNQCLSVVDSYCGDGTKQTPNDEGTGGPLNDGNEECDGEDGVGANQSCSASCVLLESLCRVKLDTVVIVDRSGSMDEDSPTRLSQAKTAANSFVGKLGSDDRSALVSFSTTANLDEPFSNNHLATQTAINSLIASGATNIGDAIGLANDEFSSSAEDVLKIEILLTDGVANKPNGDGFNENPADVAYAVEMAAEAALEGIKIFTIGLGSDINEVMLQNIADNTGAQYYNAPTADELEEIFSEIAYDICQYGSISGCKYEDSDNDGDIVGELTLPNWEINLSGDANLTQLTNGDGCYTFAGLPDGSYTVSEMGEQGVDFTQTYPQELSYNVVIEDGEEVIGYDFGNYFPICGNDILDVDEECDDGNVADGDGCSASCITESSGGGSDPVCGDGNLDTGEECDDGNTNDGDGCSSICETEGDNPVEPAFGEIVINELMWMGSELSPIGDEWIELKNTTSNKLDLSNCYLTRAVSGVETLMLGFPEGNFIEANGLYLISNYDEPNSNISIEPDLVDAAVSLSNSTLQINLYCGGEEWNDGVSISIDEAGDGGTPLAGDNEDPKKSMSRTSVLGDGTSAENWCTASTAVNWDTGVAELGTPRAQNDCGSEQSPICGDGAKEGDEECDDGNVIDGDGCSALCIIESSGGSDPVCGDGNLDAGEECDDGNTDDGDGCSSVCEIEDNDGIGAGDIVINEIMWMGSVSIIDPYPAKSSDEWIELKNTTSSEVDLSNCYLTRVVSDVKELMVSFPEGSSVEANGFYIVSNYDEENSNISITPDLVDTAVSLSNSALQIKLYCGDWNDENNLVDTADDGTGAPLEGDNGDIKKSMSRTNTPGDGSLSENWCTASTFVNWDTGVAELGTPGVLNDCEEADLQCVDNDGDGYFAYDEINCPAGDDCNDNDDSINSSAAEICDDGIDNNCDGEVDEGCSDGDDLVAILLGDVVINELMWMGSWASPTGDEWIELKNTTSESIDLSGCQLTRINSGSEDLMITVLEGVTINSGEFYLISNYDEASSNISIEPNLVDASVSLSNSALQIKLYCGGDWNDGGVLIDTAGDGGAPLAGNNGDDSEDPIIPKKSMSRINTPENGTSVGDWYTASSAVNWDSGATELGTPGSENSM